MQEDLRTCNAFFQATQGWQSVTSTKPDKAPIPACVAALCGILLSPKA